MTFQLERTSEANCSKTSEPDVFFPRTKAEVAARKWDPYCSSCPIKDMCGKAVYEGFTGVAGGEFYGTLFKVPEPKQRKVHSIPEKVLFRVALGSVIRQRRLEQGITLRAFAAKAFISPAHLSHIERGMKETSSEYSAKISETLGIAQSTLIGDAATEIAILELTAGRGAPSRA